MEQTEQLKKHWKETEEKEPDFYYGYQTGRNTERRNRYKGDILYRQNKLEKVKEYYQEHTEERKEYMRRYYQEHKKEYVGYYKKRREKIGRCMTPETKSI